MRMRLFNPATANYFRGGDAAHISLCKAVAVIGNRPQLMAPFA